MLAQTTKLIFFFLLTFGDFISYNVKADVNILLSSNFGYNFFNEHFVNTNKVKSNCEEQLAILQNGVQQKELWALKFVDAWAKLPAGILYGHNLEMGNFDECLSLHEKVVENIEIKGKYCLSNIELTNFTPNESQMNLMLGICIPAACDAEQAELLMQKYISTASNNSTILISEDRCIEKNGDSLKILDWVAIVILILLVFLMLLSTSYDYSTTHHGKPQHHLLIAFSIRNNLRSLLHLTSNATAPKHIIPALNGIRCLSIIWIIFLHTYMMLILSPNVNNNEILEWNQSLFYMVWKNGNYAVDTFFFLSGLLLISVAFREMEKKSGKLNIPLMYLHRYIRLSPVLYLAVLLYMTLYRFVGNGPVWNNFMDKNCEDTWWATLLYVQNYVAAGKMCLGHSWYLAVDTQLYFLSPIALILIWRWRRWGLAVLLFIGLLLVACLFSIVLIDDLIVFRTDTAPGSDSAEMRLTYYSTHTRVSPWIIGIIFGYYLHVRSAHRVVLSKTLILLGWLISIGLLFTVIFVLYPKTQAGADLITPLEGAFYLSLSRVAWPLGICWVVFACVNGYAGPINSFLSCPLWQPIAKLSYCMYIWHMLVVMANAGRIKTNTYFSNYDGFIQFWGNFGFTTLLSTFMYLAIEAPFKQLRI